jgi:lactoylglutathione lyase
LPPESTPTPIIDLFEAHLTVSNLELSVAFYRDVLNLPFAQAFEKPKVAFFWLGAPGKAMLGLWETGAMPIAINSHVAFQVALSDLLESPARLRASNVEPLDFHGHSTSEPCVLAWMPAAAVYFRDPSGNLLEFITMLTDPPRPELGVISWTDWTRSK